MCGRCGRAVGARAVRMGVRAFGAGCAVEVSRLAVLRATATPEQRVAAGCYPTCADCPFNRDCALEALRDGVLRLEVI